MSWVENFMTPGLHHTSCICTQSTSCDCKDDITYMYTGFYTYCPRHDNSLSMLPYSSWGTTASPQSHQKVYKTAEPGFCAQYQKYIHLADVTTQGDAIMNALNTRKVSMCLNSRNQDFSLISLGMSLPSAMTFHFKVAIPYNRKYWWSLNLVVWLQPGIINIHIWQCSVLHERWSQCRLARQSPVVEHRWAAALSEWGLQRRSVELY